MKKLILLLSFIIYTVVGNAQTPNWLWGEEGQGSGFGYCSGMALGPNDTLYVSGRTCSTLVMGGITLNMGCTDPYVGKLDTNFLSAPNTNGVWLEPGFGAGGYNYPYGICSDKENNLYQTGDENSGGSAFVVKYNNAGTVTQTNNTGVGNGQGTGVVVDNSENVYETGNYDGSPQFGSNPALTYGGSQWAGFLTKFDSTLVPIWSAHFSATDGSNENYTTGKSVALDPEGNVYVVGSYQGAGMFYSANGGSGIAAPVMPDGNGGNSGNLFVAKYDSSGIIQWVIAAPNAGMDPNSWGYVNKIKVDSCGNLYVAGYFENTATFGSISVTCSATRDMFVAKYNTKSMVWEWVETALGSGSTYATDIALDKTSDVYVVGGFTAPATFGDTVLSSGANYIAKYSNSTGDLQWVQSANISGQSAGISGVVVDGQNYCYIDGTYSGSTSMLGTVTLPNAPGGSIYLAKLDTVPPRAIIPKLDSSYCPGATFNLSYNIIGTFNAGNIFTAQLSDSSGSFANPLNIGSSTSTTGGTISVTIPNGTTPGTDYLIRVVSSNPPTSSYVNGCGAYYSKGVYVNDFYINIGSGGNIPVVLSANPSTSICNGEQDTITISGGHTYLWPDNGNSTDSVIIVNPTTTSTYNVIVTKGSCTEDTAIIITVGTTSLVNITPQSPSTCNGAGVTLSVPVSGTTYTWNPSATLSSSTGYSVVASPTITTVYTINGPNSGGCQASGTDTVFVGPAPPFNFTSASSPSTCAGEGIVLTVPTSGSGYEWNPSGTVNPDTGNTVTATPLEQTTYTVTGRDSLGCLVTAYDTVYITKGVNKPTITDIDNVLTSSATQSNQWYVNGNKITDSTRRIYDATAAGCYWTVATNLANGCSAISDTICITGINRLSINPNLLSIYPNPTGGELFVNISPSVADVKDWNLQITDVLGRTVYTRMSLNYSNEIDLSNLPGGVYFITIINNTARAVYPVVKQN